MSPALGIKFRLQKVKEDGKLFPECTVIGLTKMLAFNFKGFAEGKTCKNYREF